MLNGFRQFSLSCFLVLWLLTQVLNTCVSYTWDRHCYPGTLVPLCMAGIISILLAAKIKMSNATPFFRDATLTPQFIKQPSSFLVLRNIWILCSVPCLCISAYFATLRVLETGPKSVASLADRYGQYELAERIYRVIASDEQVSSVAKHVIQASNNSDRMIKGRKEAVEIVYGKNSNQLADLYTQLGLLKLDQKVVAYSYYQNALSIYKYNCDSAKQIEALCGKFNCCIGEKSPEKRQIYRKAQEALSRMNGPVATMTWIYLFDMAEQLGEKEQANYYDNQAVNNNPTVTQNNFDFLVWLIVVVLTLSGSGVFQVLFKELWLCRLRHALCCNLNSNPAPGAMAISLQRLIALDVHRLNFEAALATSSRLLPENQFDEALPKSQNESWAKTRWKNILRHEVICVALAGAIFWSFISNLS